MGNHNALFEGGVEVFAAIATVHWDLHRIKLILSVLLWHKLVVWLANVVVKQCHFFKSNFNMEARFF